MHVKGRVTPERIHRKETEYYFAHRVLDLPEKYVEPESIRECAARHPFDKEISMFFLN